MIAVSRSALPTGRLSQNSSGCRSSIAHVAEPFHGLCAAKGFASKFGHEAGDPSEGAGAPGASEKCWGL